MTHSSPARAQRLAGGLIGLLVGDALGVPYEFHPAAALPPAAQIEMTPPQGFSRSHASVKPGTWSDDGAQALCLLASLQHCGGLDLNDFGRRLLNWCDIGYLAVGGQVFDVGITTTLALSRLRSGMPAVRSGLAEESANGNGALMRVLPLALWHHGSDAELVQDARHSSLPTHGHLRSQQGGYEAAVKAAIGLGNDTDTTACIAGGIAGLLYGLEHIPRRWRESLREGEVARHLLDHLLQEDLLLSGES
jgi:ADP-ribosylglycohydrolase